MSRIRPLTPRRVVVAVGCLALSATVSLAEKRAFQLEDLYRVQRPSGVDLSPDGTWAVYELSTRELSRARSQSDLYRVSTTGGEPRRLTWTEEASESSPAVSPDGKWIAFVAQRGEQTADQIWLMPVGPGEARSLTDLSTGVSGPVWSPDGRAIAFTSRVHPVCGADSECNAEMDLRRSNGPLRAHVADELLYRHWASWADGAVTHVLIVDVESGGVRDVTPGEREAPVFSLGGPPGYAFSPDGSELCFTRNPDPPEELAWSTNSDLWVVALQPGPEGGLRPATNITRSNPAWDGAPAYSPDGRYIAYLRQDRPGYESDLFRLALHDREAGTTGTVELDFEERISEFHWLSDGSGWLFTGPREGRTPLLRASLDGSVTEVAGAVTLAQIAPTPDDRAVVTIRHSVGEPRELWRIDATGEVPPARLTAHNRELAEEVDIRPAESIWVTGTRGRKIQVFLVKPHKFDPARRYPLILNVHGGPQYMWSDSFRGDWQVYPGAGYVVAFANPHGSTGYGLPFTERISEDWGGAVFGDLMKVTDALAELPWVDADRMGAMGWSYGGYMMNWFQGHTKRFRCLANMMGIFDLPSFYFATEELWFPEWDLGGRPWDSKHYARWNPASSAGSFSTPMLTITGEQDFRVPYTQGLMAHTALRRRGIPSRLVVLPEAGHWPGWYEMALYYTAHLDWFHRWLGGAAPPWSVEEFAANAVFDSTTGERIDGRESE